MTNSPPLITAVIPARMGSTRYPGKPLVPIHGLAMVEHVRRRALLAEGIDHVVVATCDAAIRSAVQGAGGRAVMTSDTHKRCTDRVQEAMLHLPGEITALVSGDEPLLIPAALQQVTEPLVDDPTLDCVNLLSPLEAKADLTNPNIVKAVCDQRSHVMFLTRAPALHFLERLDVPIYRQTGIIAFRTSFLHWYSGMPETPLEKAESVDMLRVLEYGRRILGVVTDHATMGVDRPEDVPLVEQVLQDDPTQRELLERTLVIPGRS